MAASQNLNRVHSIRRAEERQRCAQMELALARLRFVETAWTSAVQRAKMARALIASSANTGELVDRLAALQEVTSAKYRCEVLREKIAAAEAEVAFTRQEFLIKRVERRQVESLLDAASAQLEVEENRNRQSVLDDWHLMQRSVKAKVVRSKATKV